MCSYGLVGMGDGMCVWINAFTVGSILFLSWPWGHEDAHVGGGSGGVVLGLGELGALELELEELSDSESSFESIEISDLKKRRWKDQILLMKLEAHGGPKVAAAPARWSSGGEGQDDPPEVRCR